MKIEETPAKIATRRFKSLLRSVFVACLLFTCVAVRAQTEPGIARSDTNINYRIGVGDVLRVIVSRQDLLSIDGVRVSNEGMIRMPMIDEDITAICLTEVELASVISEKYRKFVREPQTYVSVKEFNSHPVALIGAVNAPGRFDIRRPTRLLELLTFVNGPSANAGKTVQIIRTSGVFKCSEGQDPEISANTEEEVITLLLGETLKGTYAANPFLEAGDIISIAAADAPDEAYIIGNVLSPSSIKLSEPITISKAIAMAGGPSKDAKIEKIKIHRQDAQTLAKSEILVNLKEIFSDDQKDILLQANDIIDVPGKKPSLLRSIFDGIVMSATRGIVRF